VLLFIFSMSLSACYKEYANANYPAQAVYMPSAVNGNYLINSVAVPGQTYRYIVDLKGSRFNVPLGAYRSGITSGGNVSVSITARPDTINTLIAAGALPNTVLLPATDYTLTPSVTIPGGSVSGQFTLSIDLGFLLANPTTTYAIGVGITSTPVPANSPHNVTVIIINPAFLVPTANFSYALDANTAKQYDFTNKSVNSVSYSWDFGDGSPAVTTTLATHVYASGTYIVTLTATGAAGTLNPSVKTITLVVP